MGVGGRTIAEAKRNLSVNEFNIWIAYMTKKGMLSPPTKKPEKSQNLSEQAKRLLALNPNTVIT